MTNEHVGPTEEASDDMVSGEIDGLDDAMDTDVPAAFEAEPQSDDDQTSEIYTVQPGDDLRRIAQRFYGDPEDYERIIDANPDELRDSDVVRPGLRLTIPPRTS